MAEQNPGMQIDAALAEVQATIQAQAEQIAALQAIIQVQAEQIAALQAIVQTEPVLSNKCREVWTWVDKNVPAPIRNALVLRDSLLRPWLKRYHEQHGSTILVGYHGTPKKNWDPIIRNGFQVPDGVVVQHTNDNGFFGRGIAR